jgi:hypothetical protein
MDKHLVFENLTDYWSHAFRESKASNKSSRKESSSWNGNVNWKESKQLAQNGWLEGWKEIEKIRARISPLLTNKIVKHLPEYAICGGSLDIGTYLANDPECFITKGYDEIVQEGKIITLVCSISFSSSISASTIIQRGAIVCALIDAIEYAGYRVEIICNDTSIYNGHKFEVDVTLKKANQQLQMIEIAFCLAHPAMLRRMMFSVAEIEGWSDYASNYGCPFPATNKGTFYVDEIFSGTVSDDRAIEWMVSKLKELGVEIEYE